MIANVRERGVAPIGGRRARRARRRLPRPRHVRRAEGAAAQAAPRAAGALGAARPSSRELPEPRPIITPPPHVDRHAARARELILTAAIVGAEIDARADAAPADHAPRRSPTRPRAAATPAPRSSTSTCATPTARPRSRRELFAEAIEAHPREDRRHRADLDRRRGRHERSTSALGPLALQARDGDAQLRHAQLRRRRLRQHAPADPRHRARASARPAASPSSSATRSATSTRRSRSLEKGIIAAPLALPVRARRAGRRSARARTSCASWSRRSRTGATWGVAAVGRHQQPMTELAMRLGGHARVGLEDNIYLDEGRALRGQRAARRARRGVWQEPRPRDRRARPGARSCSEFQTPPSDAFAARLPARDDARPPAIPRRGSPSASRSSRSSRAS